MKRTMKQGALALALLGGVAQFAGPAVANSLHDEGDFGGGYRIIGPSGGPERYAYMRHHTFRPYYDGPVYTYDYGRGWGYYDYNYGSGIGLWAPGPGVVIGYWGLNRLSPSLHRHAEVQIAAWLCISTRDASALRPEKDLHERRANVC